MGAVRRPDGNEDPRALRAILEPALSSALADRPHLATFVAELERIL